MAFKRYAVIVAGGSGSRMKTATPKQFLDLNGFPVIYYSVKSFFEADLYTRVIIVLPQIFRQEWTTKIINLFPGKDIQFAIGGAERFLSVYKGLEWVPDDCVVAIHDAARPLITAELINSLFQEAMCNDCAIPAINPPETIRLEYSIDEPSIKKSNFPLLKHANSQHENRTPIAKKILFYPRDKVFLIQTPQTFMAGKLKKAYSQLFEETSLLSPTKRGLNTEQTTKKIAQQFTDDAAIWEHAGYPIKLVKGDPLNFKITLSHDLDIAALLLKKKSK